MTITQARQTLGWSKIEFAKRAGIAKQTALNAEAGKVISGRSARAIADALSQALGEKLLPGDIEGLNTNV